MAAVQGRTHRLTVLFDETCRFCTALAGWLVERSGGALAAAPIGSEHGRRALRDVAPERRYDSVHVVDPVGRRASGAASLHLLFRAVHGLEWAAPLAEAFPGATRAGYAFVTRHRRLLSRFTPPGRGTQASFSRTS